MTDLYANKGGWYKSEVFFSDWRNVGRVDYSTNAVVSWYYSGVLPQYLRTDNYNDFMARIDRGETLKIGVDYYAFYNVSSRFFTEQFYIDHSDKLRQGNVIVLKVHK